MGDYFQTIVDLDATAEEAEGRTERVVAWLVAEDVVLAERRYYMLGKLVYSPGPRWAEMTEEPRREGADGLAVVTGRTVFFGSLGSDGSPVCPRYSEAAAIGRWTAAEGARDPFSEAMDTWYATGAAEVRCPACGRPVPLPEWTWEHDRFAFAYLGFEFWNGARLLPRFMAGFGRVLGHRIRVVAGKI